MNIVRLILPLAVGAFLLFFGFLKFSGAAFIFPYMEFRAGELGFPLSDLFFPVVNYLVGAVELGAGALLVLSAFRAGLRPLAALVGVAPFAGAVVMHLSPLLGVVTPADFNPSADLDAHLAAGSGFVRSDFTAETAPALFIIAFVMLIVAAANLHLQRKAA